VFVLDHVVGAYERQCGLVVVVQPLAADLGVQLGDPARGLSVLLGTQRLPHTFRERVQRALRFGEFVSSASGVPGDGEVLAVAGGREVFDTHVDADGPAGCGKRRSGHVVAGQDDEPPVHLALDADRLHPALHRTMLVHADVADALQAHADLGVVRGGVPPAPVAVFREVDGVKVPFALEPWVSGFVAVADAAEERLERLIQPAQSRLLRRERPPALSVRVCGSDVFELCGLVAVANAGLRRVRVGVAAFLQRSVVQVAVVGQHLPHRLLLLAGRAAKELVRATHGYARSRWVSMYRRTVSALTEPTEAAKYDDDHNVGSRDLRCGNSSRSTREVNPLNWFATYEADDF